MKTLLSIIKMPFCVVAWMVYATAITLSACAHLLNWDVTRARAAMEDLWNN
ncbi:MAG: hypothetical protein HUJ96_06125 [Marinilabiliaceae bacterium]|nr:hypothetical protein [Marinilabiliaceae bacterium]